MSDDRIGSRLAALLHTLEPKTKQPASVTVLNNWIVQAEGKLGPEAKGGRLGWLVASSPRRSPSLAFNAQSTPTAGSCSSSKVAPCFNTVCTPPPGLPRTSTGLSAVTWTRFF